MATIFNSGSGLFRFGSTWEGGMPPTPFDDVLLNYFDPSQPDQTYQVTMGGRGEGVSILNLTIVDHNMLIFSSGTSLSADLLLITQNGSLIGSGAEITISAVPGTTIKASNLGLIQISNGGNLALPVTNNAGTIFADGQNTQILVVRVLNAGTIDAHDRGWCELEQVENSPDGRLIADGGVIEVNGKTTGGLGIISNNGSLDFESGADQQQPVQSTTPVRFEGPGFFQLENAEHYTGTIQGFGVGDWLCLTDIGYTPGDDFYDPVSGILTISDGTQTSELRISGTYADDDFVFKEGPSGGTYVTSNKLGSSAPDTVDGSDLHIASLYLGYFGRAGDPAGHAYWYDQLAASLGDPGKLAALAASFSVQAEAKATYPLLADPQHATQAEISSFIDSVYENLFGRAPDGPGASYWQSQLSASIGSAQGIGTFILNVISGAQGVDAATLANRSEAAAFFSDHLGLAQLPYDAAADAMARSALDGVTHDDATVVAAEMAMSDFIDSQQLVLLTGLMDASG